MKSLPILFLALVAASAHAGPRASTDYRIAAESLDAGGRRATSTSYTYDGSVGGVVGVSTVATPAQTVKAGYIGQLYEVSGLVVDAAGATTVNEMMTLQLAAWQLLDDGSRLAVDANEVAWSVVSGPVTGIDAGGLATAGVVDEDTPATVQATYGGFTATLVLTVLDTRVTTLADSGPGSLRDTIAALPPGGTITFDPSLDGGTITLASQISIDKSLTVDASALPNGLTISGNNASRILEVGPSPPIVARFDVGGDSFNGPNQTLLAGWADLNPNNMTATQSGITLTIDDSSPESRNRTGPVIAGDPLENVLRDFLFTRSADGAVAVTFSGLTANADYEITGYAYDSSGGNNETGYWYLGSVAPENLQHTWLSSTATLDDPGDIFVLTGTADSSGTLTYLVTTDNTSRINGFVVRRALDVTLDSLTFTGGASDTGAAIFNEGTLTLDRVTLSGNTSTDRAGAIFNLGILTLERSTVSGNSAVNGGGIFNDAIGTLIIRNSTFSGNSASGDGGAVFGTLTLNHSTLSGNTANYGGGVFNDTGQPVDLAHSIVAGNTGTSGSPNLHGSYSESGTNLVSGDPFLAPLGWYGGPTQTMPPLPESPAIDAAGSTALTTDQRGFDRPVDGDNDATAVPDIGAVEYDPTKDLLIRLIEDFESPDITGAQAVQSSVNGNPCSNILPDNGKWVGSNQGFGSDGKGLDDEAAGYFTDPFGAQAFAFRYTNSGITTAAGKIGPLGTGIFHTVSFDVVKDGHNDGLPYTAQLIAFAAGAARNDARETPAGSLVLKEVTGSATGDGQYTTVSFTYLQGEAADESHLGYDLGLRFKGATTSATIDNVRVWSSGGPGPVASFAISPVESPQTVGTPISGIILTAKDAANQTATGFSGSVTFSGTGGFSGSSANFVGGVLTNVSVTPTVSGSNLTLVVDDGAGHTGSTTIGTIQTPYAAWSGGTAFDNDSNGDGVTDGMAWVLGAANPAEDAIGLLPAFDNTDPEYFVFTYRRADQAHADSATNIAVEYGSGLNGWTPAAHDGSDIIITPTDNFHGTDPGIDKVEVKIKRTLAIGGKLFARLNVANPTGP